MLIHLRKNIGISDRLIRLVLALILFFIAYWKGSWIAFAFALFTLFEFFMSWCILYQILGKSSCPTHKK
ncbi:MAG: DUF2892 domain-containing protein [Chlamydiota bacterium]